MSTRDRHTTATLWVVKPSIPFLEHLLPRRSPEVPFPTLLKRRSNSSKMAVIWNSLTTRHNHFDDWIALPSFSRFFPDDELFCEPSSTKWLWYDWKTFHNQFDVLDRKNVPRAWWCVDVPLTLDTILLIKAGCDMSISMTANFEGRSVPDVFFFVELNLLCWRQRTPHERQGSERQLCRGTCYLTTHVFHTESTGFWVMRLISKLIL